MVVYIIYIYGGGGPPGPKNARADFLSQSSPGHPCVGAPVLLFIIIIIA